MTELISRHLMPVARQMLTTFPGLIIEGARQVGKTTLTSMLAPGATMVNLDDDLVRATAEEDPGLLLRSSGTTVVDEIQQVPGLTLAIKAAIDTDRRPGQFILTGSSSLLSVRGLTDSLVGRVGRLALFGLSRGEVAGRRDDFAAAFATTGPQDPDIANFHTTHERSDYASMLGRGAYPDLRDANDRTARQWLESYIHGTVYRDLGELRREYRPERGLATLRVLSARPASELVAATLARDTAIPAGTVRTYLDLWRAVGVLGVIPPWTPNLAKRESGRSKVFVIDSGLAMRAARVTAAHLLTPTNLEYFGLYLEAFVAAELLRQRTWSQVDYDLYHYRDRDGMEVDLVLELSDGSVIAVEVKASTTYRPDHFAGLRRLRDQLGSRFLAGVVLSTAKRGWHFSDRLYGAPIASLWEL